MSDDNGSGGCGCGGCITALVIGTAIMGTIALGGVGPAWMKVKSTWDYDNQIQAVHKIMDENNNGILDPEEATRMYQELNIPTIEGKAPTVKIPYKSLVELTEKYGQRV